MKLETIYPCLWFDHQAEQAATFYASIFPRSRIVTVSRYAEGGRGEVGKVMYVEMMLGGGRLGMINGGPHYALTPAVSLRVGCSTQREIDTLWRKLVSGGKPSRCGWLTDKFGLSWQIVPVQLAKFLRSKQPAKREAVTRAFMSMVKLDIKGLTKAYDKA